MWSWIVLPEVINFWGDYKISPSTVYAVYKQYNFSIWICYCLILQVCFFLYLQKIAYTASWTLVFIAVYWRQQMLDSKYKTSALLTLHYHMYWESCYLVETEVLLWIETTRLIQTWLDLTWHVLIWLD